jgi:hypothetical protein
MRNGIKMKYSYSNPNSNTRHFGEVIINNHSVENLKHNGFDFNKSTFNFNRYYFNEDGDLIIVLMVNSTGRLIFINTNKEKNINKKILKFICGLYWFQKEEKVRYVINLLFLSAGLYIAYMKK